MKQSNITAHHLFNSRFTSIVSISLVIFLIGATSLLLILAGDLSVFVRENLTLSVVLKDNAKISDIQKLQKTIDAAVYSKETLYIDKETAIKELSEELGQDPAEFLGFNPLFGSIEIKLNSDYANNDSIANIENDLKHLPEVKEIIYQKSLIDSVNKNVRSISFILILLSALLLIISYALISNTIRLTVYAKRFLIHTMQLVGATGSFIRRPFLMQGVVIGLISAFLAMAYLSITLHFVNSEMSHLFSLETVDALLVSFFIMIIAGITITLISTYISVTRYLKIKVDEMYYI